MRIVNVPTKAWQRIPKYSDYPFMAKIPIDKATPDMFPYAEFEKEEAESGNFAMICESVSGGVLIYAKEKPAKEIKVNVSLYSGGI